MDGHADLLQGVNGGDLEVEAGVFGDDLSQLGHVGVNPVHPEGVTDLGNSFDSSHSDGMDSVFEVV